MHNRLPEHCLKPASQVPSNTTLILQLQVCSTIPVSVKNQLNGCPLMPARAAGILGQVTFQSRLRLETGDTIVGLQFIWNSDGTLAQVQIKVTGDAH